MTYEELVAEYEKHKKETIGGIERVGEWFSGVDERIDYLAPKVFEVLRNTEEIKTALAGLGVEVMIPVIEQMRFQEIVLQAPLVGSAVRRSELPPYAGYIKSVIVAWPDGANNLVDVRVGHGNTQFLPWQEGTYLSLNDATPKYVFNEWVDDNEEIWVEIINGDGVNPHTITVTLEIEKGA